MGDLINIINTNRNRYLINEDGDAIMINLNEGVSASDILNFEAANSIKMPENLKELMMMSNGMDLFGLQILSLEEMEFFPNSAILSFHNWGNGDFDCLSFGGVYPKGAVVFISHSEDDSALVCDSLYEWFNKVIVEIERVGTVLHPLDYTEQATEGLYKNIL